MADDDMPVMPPPARGQHFNNTGVRRVAAVDRRTTRPKKDVVQFNTYVPPSFPARVEAFQRQYEADIGRDLTRGQFLEQLLACWEESRAKGALPKGLPASVVPEPDDFDREQERTELTTFWASRQMLDILHREAAANAWTLGGVIENFMGMAADCRQAEAELARLRNTKRGP